MSPDDTRIAWALDQAVRNNAIWCDKVCLAHGSPGSFLGDIWINQDDVPRFYPNAITLAVENTPGEQVERIGQLVGARASRGCGVKDSFSALDLTQLGFMVVFEAQWIYAARGSITLPVSDAGLRWTCVSTDMELAEWEKAWSGDEAGSVQEDRIFLPALLKDEGIAFVAGYFGSRIVAGVIGCRTGQVVGVSNIFVPAADSGELRARCLVAIAELFPGLDFVDYEHGEELSAMKLLGFEEIGSLRIWVR
jgi:hypothetical protein